MSAQKFDLEINIGGIFFFFFGNQVFGNQVFICSFVTESK